MASLNRPGANVTGATFITAALAAKRLELLRELVPNVATVGVLVNRKNELADTQLNDVHLAARTRGQPLYVVNSSSEGEFEPAYAPYCQTLAIAAMPMTVPAEHEALARARQSLMA